MAFNPPRTERRRARPGSLQRPVNGRLYRGTWLLVGLPLLLAAFSVARPTPLPRAFLPAFDGAETKTLAESLADDHPFRQPGSLAAAQWFRDQLDPYGLPIHTETLQCRDPRARQGPPAEPDRRSSRSLAARDRRDGTSRQRRTRARCERQRVRDGDVDPARPRLRRTARPAVRTTAPEPHDSLRVDRRRRVRRGRRRLVRKALSLSE